MTLIMGVLNVTPDSFSDGGRFFNRDNAIAHARELIADGADLIDIGGESTRPGATRVSPEEEQRRIIPVIRDLAADGVRISVDTMHASTALLAASAGAEIINDVSGGLADPDMPRVAAETGLAFVAMHWRGYLTDPNERVHYDDVVVEVARELEQRLDALRAVGIADDKLIVDPGIGFSKNAEHNWAVLANIDAFTALGRPVLIGASRKRFLSELLPAGAAPSDRDPATSSVSIMCAQAGAWAVRVHDVGGTRTAFTVLRSITDARHAG